MCAVLDFLRSERYLSDWYQVWVSGDDSFFSVEIDRTVLPVGYEAIFIHSPIYILDKERAKALGGFQQTQKNGSARYPTYVKQNGVSRGRNLSRYLVVKRPR